MHTLMTPEDRIAELEDALKLKDRRLREVKADLDNANNIIERQNEHVEDCRNVIEAWKEAFDMRPTDNGGWTWAPWVDACEEYHDKYVELARKWNRNVADFNAMVHWLPATHSGRTSSSCAKPASRCDQTLRKPVSA
jgi:hypothetical protein